MMDIQKKIPDIPYTFPLREKNPANGIPVRKRRVRSDWRVGV
ncbi:hypothetical protein [Gluconacetobacter dulcium]|nr:hypothetical protein [Gluconacetobacter dulcium]